MARFEKLSNWSSWLLQRRGLALSSGCQAIIRLASRCREKLGYSQCKSHIPGYFELATEKGALSIEFSFCQGYPVFIADGERDIGLLYSTWDKFTISDKDLESPDPCLFSSNVPLER